MAVERNQRRVAEKKVFLVSDIRLDPAGNRRRFLTSLGLLTLAGCAGRALPMNSGRQSQSTSIYCNPVTHQCTNPSPPPIQELDITAASNTGATAYGQDSNNENGLIWAYDATGGAKVTGNWLGSLSGYLPYRAWPVGDKWTDTANGLTLTVTSPTTGTTTITVTDSTGSVLATAQWDSNLNLTVQAANGAKHTERVNLRCQADYENIAAAAIAYALALAATAAAGPVGVIALVAANFALLSAVDTAKADGC